MDRGRSAHAPAGFSRSQGRPRAPKASQAKANQVWGRLKGAIGEPRVSPPRTSWPPSQAPCPASEPFPASLDPSQARGLPERKSMRPGDLQAPRSPLQSAPGPGRPPRPADASREPDASRPGCFPRPPPLKATHHLDLADPAAAAARFPARRRFRVPFVAIPRRPPEGARGTESRPSRISPAAVNSDLKRKEQKKKERKKEEKSGSPGLSSCLACKGIACGTKAALLNINPSLSINAFLVTFKSHLGFGCKGGLPRELGRGGVLC